MVSSYQGCFLIQWEQQLWESLQGNICHSKPLEQSAIHPGVGRRTFVLPENMHSAKAIISTTSRSLGSLGFEQNGSCSHPYSQRLASSFTTSRCAMELKTTKPHAYICIQSSFREIPLAHTRIHLKSYRNN